MQFADLADRIGTAGALIQTNRLSFFIFRIFLLFPENFLKVEGCFVEEAHENTYVAVFKRCRFPPMDSGLKVSNFCFAVTRRYSLLH
jgi:hypothetical protein